MRLVPAAADTGIVFIRTDITDRDEASIPALFGSVCDVTLSTKIGNSHGHVVGTIEHLLAALAGMRVDNVIVEIDGPEVPIMDGSAQPFVDLMHSVGIVELDAVRRALRVKKPVRVSQGDSYCELLPEDGCVFEAEIDFQSGAIGRQAISLTLWPKILTWMSPVRVRSACCIRLKPCTARGLHWAVPLKTPFWLMVMSS